MGLEPRYGESDSVGGLLVRVYNRTLLDEQPFYGHLFLDEGGGFRIETHEHSVEVRGKALNCVVFAEVIDEAVVDAPQQQGKYYQGTVMGIFHKRLLGAPTILIVRNDRITGSQTIKVPEGYY